MRKGNKITVPRSMEHRKKLSQAMMGNKNQEREHNPETRMKIAKALKGNKNTLGKRYDQQTRLRDSLAKTGESNPAWNGGTSFLPYPPEFSITFKESILLRDHYTCRLCGTRPENKKELHPHHIDYDKKNCNSINLITLCHSCHSKTNHHRKEWRIFNGQFQRIPVYA